jgi:hypothetical protein
MTDRCPTCGQAKKRTLPQNARLHALFTQLAANVTAKDGLYHPAQWWKVMSKDRWLGYDEFRRPDGTVITVMRSTADCDVEELTNFMNEVERYAASRGVYLDDVWGQAA